MRLSHIVCAVLCGIFLSAGKSEEISTTKLQKGVYMLKGRGGNVLASVGADGVLIVDDQFKEEVPKIRRTLARLSKRPLAYILNTHYHRDHTGGNAELGKRADVVAHEHVRDRLLGEGKPTSALPEITFSDRMTLFFNGTEFRALHIPNAHTDGDTAVYLPKERVLHTGDLFFHPRFPYVDLDAGGNAKGVLAGVDQLLKWVHPDAQVIPGHGPLATVKDLRTYRNMLAETIATVEAQKRKGASLAAVKKKGLAAKWTSWGQGFIKEDVWIETVYRSIP